ncbi:uncharacterized protein EV420DRAFT_365283 [Desarmillaria tabescens]|uniref:Uncharacterized protein n=1 Tax=Armillaria tabescens TaxID=1929756 RepID=A0AA39KD22_ARMTA|nr:uncharacterized protein EV420DRAFT_365283 [Desarmillaria tabescens]KAK0458573.1 hypothetical protein EV420DRAFT_365283 [Desarmillaria tabescens]
MSFFTLRLAFTLSHSTLPASLEIRGQLSRRRLSLTSSKSIFGIALPRFTLTLSICLRNCTRCLSYLRPRFGAVDMLCWHPTPTRTRYMRELSMDSGE